VLALENINYLISDKIILDNISFKVENGDSVVIIGPNGSGKSTLLKIILGINNKYSGVVKIDNTISIGYVPQIKNFDKKFPATAIELVITGILNRWSFKNSDIDKNNAMEILEILNATTLANKQVSALSGGELQKIFLARAIIRKPHLLILDEPDTGLDNITATEIQKQIQTMNTTGTTIISVTHNIYTAKKYANKILLLNKKIIFYGNIENGLTEENLLNTFRY
jgi:zinc transport system ATP-binding protein